jgi:exopolyphosphatase/guanosine-5'-triphosphate,3'-diphosphate pyrophosphatase
MLNSQEIVPRFSNPILAAIDIGTNSVHMIVVRINAEFGAFSTIAREKETVRLGDREPKTGNLTKEAMERTISALQRCKDLANSLDASQTIAIATSATREAPNGREFLEQIKERVGLSVDLISGQEEARRIYLGVLSGVDFNQQSHIILDIGGGSTELILGNSEEPLFLSSTKIGAVRLTQDFVKNDPVSASEQIAMRAYIQGMLERPIDELKSSLMPEEQVGIIGTSGTIETLATVHALNKLGYVPNPLNGYQMKRRDIREMVRNFATLSCISRTLIPGVSERRSEIIYAGSLILLETMTMLEIDTITLCERALREGIIVDWMLAHGYIDSRLSYQKEVKSRSVMKISHKYGVDLEHSKNVAAFAISFFEQTKGLLHNWGVNEKDLLWAASILHNSGIHINHSAHHKHSYYLIRNSELLGYTEIELELIANIARYHRRSKPKRRHESYSQLSESQKQLVRELSAILRLAVAMDRRQIGAVSQIECKYDAEYRSLHLHIFPLQADDNCALELWSLNYKKMVFEEEFKVKLLTTLAK